MLTSLGNQLMQVSLEGEAGGHGALPEPEARHLDSTDGAASPEVRAVDCGSWSEKELNKLKVQQLKTMLSDRDLPTSGKVFVACVLPRDTHTRTHTACKFSQRLDALRSTLVLYGDLTDEILIR